MKFQQCGRVLSSNNTTPINCNFGICCELLASACLTACHIDEHCLLLNCLYSTGPCKFRKSVRIPFPAVCCVLNIFLTGDVGYFHSRLWHLLYCSEWYIHILSPVMMHLTKAPLCHDFNSKGADRFPNDMFLL